MGTISNQAYMSSNLTLGDMLHEIASCYRYLGSDYRFKVMAYTAAARTLHGLNIDIASYVKRGAELRKLRGIDEDIALEIMQYLRTGKIKTYERLKKKVPLGLLELMDVKGFGPVTIKTIHEKLHVNTRNEMKIALLSGRLESFEGMGQRKIENMKRGLKLFKEVHSQLQLWDAISIGSDVLKQLLALPGVKNAVICGSLRRNKETIADIDIIVMARRKYWEKISQTFCDLPFVHRVIVAGGKRISVLLKNHNTQVDIQLVHEHEYGAALLLLTGSKEHSIALKKWADNKGFLLNENGVFDAGTGKWLAGTNEEEIYRLLGLQFIPPELREDKGEIEKAAKHRLPLLVEENDIRGDMQVHSSWSNNEEEIETIARHVRRVYPQYEYIVITDCLSGQLGTGGLQPEEFINQFAEIDMVNKALGQQFVKKGVDVHILEDGSLNLQDNILQQFEWVTASIVSGFDKDNTGRLIKACENPNVHCLNHPSGRLIGKRDAWTVNWKKLIEKAASTGTCMAINAQPDRLDLKDELVKAAIDKGVKICIGTGARDLNQFDLMSTGVAVARRGWCTKENILNTCSWKEVEYFKQYKQSIMCNTGI
ncbi:DNA polymerase III [Niastella vici]|uniref:DNA-directed DNA polymerase n=1 Tax=Niastella vici TaxID=1703345 RepID=A0A1V9FZL9_9BACT|nr:DNA polymerase III [Niastella vici]OQP63825.1 DNA polymerase III [Niastella vici]